MNTKSYTQDSVKREADTKNFETDRTCVLIPEITQGVCSGGHVGPVGGVCTHEHCVGAPFRA